MLILFTHDDQAQVIIHTANMISRVNTSDRLGRDSFTDKTPQDWGNMTQAVWSSPLLPLLTSSATIDTLNSIHPIGSGERFKVDLLEYLKAYGKRVDGVTKQLRDYDFSAIKAAFVGSAPSRQKPTVANSSGQTSFGWLGLQEILSKIPIAARSNAAMSPPHIVIQVSSIATLGAAPTWLTQFQSALSSSAITPVATSTLAPKPKLSSFFSKPEPSSIKQDKSLRPKFNIIFPTPNEIRTSLDGYASGGSIHTKLQSAQQQKQLEYLHPIFCHWKAFPSPPGTTMKDHLRGQALRGPAAPHIKTYVRFSDESHETIDWAMVTSANLSKQAWGDVVNKKEEIWIQSWEAGVVVWPELFALSGSERETIMIPVFGKDKPGEEDVPMRTDDVGGDESGDRMQGLGKEQDKAKTIVGFRMPYDLPLTSYGPNDKPWCATMKYSEPDWKGLTWGGY
jgi:tyrosyl-DNA phosphodiesterase-1